MDNVSALVVDLRPLYGGDETRATTAPAPDGMGSLSGTPGGMGSSSEGPNSAAGV
jgi:hypothetical protein